MKVNYKLAVITVGILTSAYASLAQVSSDSVDLFTLDLEDLMNIEIVSASKKSESLFEAPLSASVITKDEIRNAGSTSIMEALRLVPGVIVREQTNGNFQVHVRGHGNVPPNANFADMANTTTLVMIDNRPVYNYFQGGTFWETLPIDLNDVERIEVVRGPAAAMYGPNAVSGVINIITSHPNENGFFARGNAQAGSNRTFINNATLGYQFNDKLDISISGNMQQRDRHQSSYYEFYRNQYIDSPASLRNLQLGDSISDVDSKFKNPNLALRKYAGNAFVNYSPSKKIAFNFATGSERSEAQKVYSENATVTLATANSNTDYIDLKSTIYGFSSQLSYLKGSQTASQGYPGEKWDFNTLDAFVEYNFTFGNLTVKPGLTYRRAEYDDRNYANTEIKKGWINSKKEITTKAASIRADYKLLDDKLRFISALRVDKFNVSDDAYLSYQFAGSYKLNKKHFFRAVLSKANRSPFLIYNYIDQIPFRVPVGPNTFMEGHVVGRENLKLLTSKLIELGYRVQLANNLQLDVEAFGSDSRNYTNAIEKQPVFYMENNNTIIRRPIAMEDIPLKVKQGGVTLSINYVLTNFHIKPFVTYQKTKLYDYSPYYFTADAMPSFAPNVGNKGNPVENNYLAGIGSTMTDKGSPTTFGGIYVNYSPNAKWNFNVNPYFYSQHTLSHFINVNFAGDGVRGISEVNGKFILNAKASYSPSDIVSIFISAKNLLNDDSYEFFYTDNISTSVLAGVNLKF